LGDITLADDVRMRGFKKRSPVKDTLDWIHKQSINLSEETISIYVATGRILAKDIVSPLNIPGFDRSMMDGYAIIASDAQGASTYNQLQLTGQSMPGHGTDVKVTPGTAVKIMTGAPVPNGENAVLPAENVEINEPFIFVSESVAEGRNIGRTGEDVTSGNTVLKQGRRLRPQDIALLASIGIKEISVVKKIRVSIIITGNKILPLFVFLVNK
jgi:molybdopterin molybdotransferase